MEKAARSVVENCLGVTSSEEVLIIVDEKTRHLGKALFAAAKSSSAEAVLLEMTERESHGEIHGSEPPRLVAEAMKKADVIIVPTSKSLTHTKARLEATECGARIVSLPGVSEELFVRAMSADYMKIKERTLKLQALLSNSQEVRLTTPAGTDLTFSMIGRKALADTGVLREKGAVGNLPAGEVFISPLEGKTFGVAVVDGLMVGIGVIETPIKMIVKEGYVTEISGASEAKALLALLQDKGKSAKNIASLGIGTNDQAIHSGNLLEEKKVMGTAYVAIGESIAVGGKVDALVHLAGIMNNPTLLIDAKIIIEKGHHLI